MTAPRLVVIVGPTGAGKTALALALAAAADGEIVSCGLAAGLSPAWIIGTGKVSAAERARAPHHLLDVILRPDEEMTAAAVRRPGRSPRSPTSPGAAAR
jgi:tRNA dimethylallyltransferase